MNKTCFKILLTVLTLCITSSLYPTHGIHPVGVGTKSLGMGGVAAAYPQDTLISSVNPAGMYWVPNELDIGVGLFMPFRKYSYTAFGGEEVKSGRNYFFIPHVGYSQGLGDNAVFGISFYGQGGMNTSYPRNNPVFGQRKLGIDYAVALLAPTFAFAIFPECLPSHSIGIPPLFAVQTFKIAGLQNFQPLLKIYTNLFKTV